MATNLLLDRWIPIRRESGYVGRIAPWQVTEANDPIVALAAPRPDFNGALMQFLIGLLQTAAAPKDHDAWVDRLEEPPTPEELKARFIPIADAFKLDGDGPRFMQDFEDLDGEAKPISTLLIEAPGAQALRQNTDHFIKRGRLEALCPACTASALFTLQTNAPAGGAGHRTSLRGGGPLTTLVVMDPEGSKLPETLWRNLWLNVFDAKMLGGLSGNLAKTQRSDIFPWLSSTRTSEPKTGQATTPEDTHPLHVYWAMPRRIRIDWRECTDGPCDLCGDEREPLVTRYVTRNYGTNYEGPWQHPLSPHYIDAKTGLPMPVHAQPGGLSYRHWLGWVEGSDTLKPAKVVTAFQVDTGRKLENEQLRVWAFGYDMDNMKARCWYEATFPLLLVPDEQLRREFSIRVQAMVDVANQVAGFVQSCIKEAWFKRPGDARGDTGFLKQAFFSQTETPFYGILNRLLEAIPASEEEIVLRSWHEALRTAAMNLFDYWAGRGEVAFAEPRRIAVAHQKLRNLIHGKKLLAGLGINIKKGEAA